MRLYLKSKRIPRRVGPCVRVSMYIWACMYACMYMCVYDVAPHEHLCMDVCTCMRMTLHLKSKRVPHFSAMYECMYMCVFACLCVRMSAFFFKYVHVCMHAYACMHVNLCMAFCFPPTVAAHQKTSNDWIIWMCQCMDTIYVRVRSCVIVRVHVCDRYPQ